MVGIVEAVAFAAFPVSCAPAASSNNPHAANATGIKETLRIVPYPPFIPRDVNSGSAVPEEEPGEKTNPHKGKSQIDMPSVQHRCRHDRTQGGQDQQEGSPALRQFLLFDHSRFSSRLSDAHSASHQRFFPALSSRQLSAQVDHLPNMMIRMPGTTKENLETVRSFRFALASVRHSPIVRLLFPNRRHHHRDRSIKGA